MSFKNYKGIEKPPERLLKNSFKKILATDYFSVKVLKKLRNIYKLLKLIIEM